MKKSLVTLLIACSSAVPLAAHGQIANVRLYGNLNLDFEFIKGRQPVGACGDAESACNPTVNRLSSNSSRFGVRGNEYLGRGQVAIFQIESSINGDTNSGNLGGRETFVGLQGDWGTVKLGRFLTPYDDVLPIFGNTPTLTTSILSTAAIWAQGPLSKVQGGFDARLGNSIRYETPLLDGLTGSLQYSTRDSSGNADAADNGDHISELRHASVLGIGALYSKGPLDLGAAFERNHRVRFSNTDDDAFTIAAGYDLGTLAGSNGLRVGGVYERLRYETPTGDLKRDFWGISGTVPLAGGSIYGFWGHASNGKGQAVDGTTIGGLTKGPDSSSDQWEISYSYSLSLRTLLYAGYVRINNSANAGYGFNINDYSTVRGARPTGYVLGMVHFF
jgi:predicted porin